MGRELREAVGVGEVRDVEGVDPVLAGDLDEREAAVELDVEAEGVLEAEGFEPVAGQVPDEAGGLAGVLENVEALRVVEDDDPVVLDVEIHHLQVFLGAELLLHDQTVGAELSEWVGLIRGILVPDVDLEVGLFRLGLIEELIVDEGCDEEGDIFAVVGHRLPVEELAGEREGESLVLVGRESVDVDQVEELIALDPLLRIDGLLEALDDDDGFVEVVDVEAGHRLALLDRDIRGIDEAGGTGTLEIRQKSDFEISWWRGEIVRE